MNSTAAVGEHVSHREESVGRGHQSAGLNRRQLRTQQYEKDEDNEEDELSKVIPMRGSKKAKHNLAKRAEENGAREDEKEEEREEEEKGEESPKRIAHGKNSPAAEEIGNRSRDS